MSTGYTVERIIKALEKAKPDSTLVAVFGDKRVAIEQEPIETEMDEDDEYEMGVEFCPQAYDASYPPIHVTEALRKLKRYEKSMQTYVTDQYGGCESLRHIIKVTRVRDTVELHAGDQ